MASTSVFAGLKRVPKAQLDADGNEVQVEVRGDEEQRVKYEQIIELLLAAGYFRARISSLSQFDKVVGGMVWSITASNVGVDVDILFQENATIGQRIAVTEKIVAALPKMKCPQRIEPHQIQGLDCIHIFPVIQWLVKKVIEVREETGDYIRNFSVSQFHKEHSLPQDDEFALRKVFSIGTVQTVKESYKPVRKYRRPPKHDSRTARNAEDETNRVQATLLEYGHRYRVGRDDENADGSAGADGQKGTGGGLSSSRGAVKGVVGAQGQQGGLAGGASGGASGSSKEKEGENEALLEEERIKALMGVMSALSGDAAAVSTAAVGAMVGMQSDEISEMASAYAEKHAALVDGLGGSGAGSGAGGLAGHQRQTQSLEKQIAAREKRLAEIADEHASLAARHAELQEDVGKAAAYNARIDREAAKLDAMENESNSAALEQLRALVAINEALKRQEADFKASCKDEMARLQELIRSLGHDDGTDAEEAERIRQIDAQFEADREKMRKLRLLVGKKNRDIAAVQRKIDEVPSRAELSQYQRRFVELYNTVAAKLTETKQYFTLYNTLDDTRLYLSKEVSLLNSIHDNFERAMSTAQNKDQFLHQMESIVAGIKSNLDKVERKKADEKAKRDKLNDGYLQLVDAQRHYYKTVKEFQEECRKNELLQAKLKTGGQ
eukprot:Opistho-2@33072